ncbi:MAG: hypothetical protein EXR68_05850 [Dehalococcoidia bacterium]|nr:hypothetical protein [Dehalococcoidia bacterium]
MNRVRPGTIPALVAAPIAFAAAAHYLSVIFARHRDVPPPPMPVEVGVWFIAGYAIAGGVLAVTAVTLPRGRAYVLAAAAGMIAFIGMLGTVSSLSLTFGLSLLLAACLTGVATVRAWRFEGAGKAAMFATALLMYLVGIGGYAATVVLPR